MNGKVITRKDKEKLLNQKSKVVWLTGLSGSGKSTLAYQLEYLLFKRGNLVQVLDGDHIRSGMNNDLNFSEQDRKENIRRVTELAKILVDSGVIVICSFISPTKQIRDQVKKRIGKDDFIEVFLNTPLHICESRDPKGLYLKAKKGLIHNFTGIDAVYEVPENPDFSVTYTIPTEQSATAIINKFL